MNLCTRSLDVVSGGGRGWMFSDYKWYHEIQVTTHRTVVCGFSFISLRLGSQQKLIKHVFKGRTIYYMANSTEERA